MTIKHQGGIFGRNPTFNNVDVDGVLTVDQIAEKTAAAGITLDGVTLKDGNVVLADGNGIDFSATSGTGTSELFDDYEEGTWTPTQGSFTTWTSPTFAATYTKVGRLVTLNIAQTGGVIAASSAALYIGGSPYSAANDAVGVVSDGSINDHGHCVAGGTNIFFSNIIAPEINFIVTITFHVA
jgi:hypothetical protein